MPNKLSRGRARAAVEHRRVDFCSRFDLRKKSFCNVITFESKLKKLKNGEIKVYRIQIGEYFLVFRLDLVLNHGKKKGIFRTSKTSADVPARWLGRRNEEKIFKSRNNSVKSSLRRVGAAAKKVQVQGSLSPIRLKTKEVVGTRLCAHQSSNELWLANELLKPSLVLILILIGMGLRLSGTIIISSITKVNLEQLERPNKVNLTEGVVSLYRGSHIEIFSNDTDQTQSENPIKVQTEKLVGWLCYLLILLSGDISPNPGPEPIQADEIDGNNDATRIPADEPEPEPDLETDAVNPGPDAAQNHDEITSGKKWGKVQIKTMTYNVRGLNDQHKVRHLINLLNKEYLGKDYDAVIALQETNVLKAGILPYVWRGNYSLTAGTGNSKGCITLLSSHINVVECCEIEERGHVLACQRSDSNGVNYVVANIYAPNSHNNLKIDFFEEVLGKISDFENKYNCDNVILLGDFNVIFKDAEKKNRLFTQSERRIGKVIKNFFRDMNLTDIWETNGEYTWRRANTDTFSILDRILYRSVWLAPRPPEVDWSLGFSDHAAVKVSFINRAVKTKYNKTGIRTPRLDPSILKDERLKKRVREEFVSLIEMMPANWDPHLKLEYTKMSLRSVVERIQAERNRKERTMEKEVDEAINRAIKELAGEEQEEQKLEYIERIENLRNKKLAIVEEKGARLAEKLATKWYNEGEKSTKYFYRLLNRQMPDKMTGLVDEHGREIEGEREINEAVTKFYKDLYETQDNVIIEPNDNFLENINAIPGANAEEVVKEITLENLKETLSKCADSAPGPDGINYSYLREFWDVIGPLLTDSWRHSRVTGALPVSHRQSVLRLIPKSGKDLKKLTNWRPITLSNCDHKLITKTYATRLTAQLEGSIKNRQTAYLKGRVITDNVRALLSCVKISNLDEEIDGIITSLDARKAFDSVNHEYIKRCLSKFGLDDFIPIFAILYKDLSSDIALNGTLIKGYKILRGVKQGDALSCILFIMCMEPLLRNIEENNDIKAVRSAALNIEIPKAFAYADDVNLVSQNDRNSVKEIFKEYERLTKASGLMLNADKTEIMRLSKNSNQELSYGVRYMGSAFRLKSQAEIKINGILFQQDEQRMRDGNVEEIIRKIKKKLEPWSRRSLSLVGKILLMKTFGVSQIIYLMQCFVLSPSNIKCLNNVLYKFLWNRHFNAAKAPERIKREIINKPIKLGGFGMLDIVNLDNSLKLRILGRLLTSQHPFSLIVKEALDVQDFFFPKLNLNICDVTQKAIEVLKKCRLRILDNQDLTNKVKLVSLLKETKIKNILSPAGVNSVLYFRLRIAGTQKIGQLTRQQLDQIRRLIKEEAFVPWIEATHQLRLPAPTRDDLLSIWHCEKLASLSQVSTKQFREIMEDSTPITSFKIGFNLGVNDSLTWCYQVKKLKSARHQTTMLKIAHGDMYTNDRLLRFGLRDNDSCDRCGNTDSRAHRVATCPKALALWNEARSLCNQQPLTDTDPDLLKIVLGIKDPLGGELVLHAELLQVLNNTLDLKINTVPTKLALKMTLKKLYNVEKGQCKDSIKALLDKIG